MGNMGRLAGQLAFGVAGGLLGGPTGFAIGNLIGGLLFGQRPQKPAASSVDKLRIPQTQAGVMFPLMYGDTCVEGEKAGWRSAGIWIDCDKDGGITQSTSSDGTRHGTLGGHREESEETQYFLTGALAIADAVVAPVIVDKITVNDETIYDRFAAEPGYTLTDELVAGDVVGEISDELELWRGDWRQPVSTILTQVHSPDLVPAYRGIAYLVFKNLPIKTQPTITVVMRNGIQGLRAIVKRHLMLANIPEANIRLCAIAGAIPGAFQNNVGPPRALAEQCARYAGCDLVEVDGVIADTDRSNPYQTTLTRDELSARDTLDMTPTVTIATEPDDELPSHLRIRYQSLNLNWDDDEAEGVRHTSAHYNVETVELGIVSNKREMAKRAQMWLDERWAERYSIEIALPRPRIKRIPGNVFTVPLPNGETIKMRLGQQNLGNILACEGRSWEGGVYTNHPTHDQGDRPGLTNDVYLTPIMFMADTVPLTDFMADRAGFLLAASTDIIHPWAGAYFASGGLQGLGNMVLPVAAEMGDTDSALTLGSGNQFDYTRTLRVIMQRGALVSATEAEVRAGANVLAVQDGAGSARIIQFVTSTLFTDVPLPTYDITGLLDGRKGSDNGGTIASGARCCLLADESGTPSSAVKFLDLSLSKIRVARDWAVKSRGFGSGFGATQQFTVNGNSLKVLSVVRPTASPVAPRGSVDVALTWDPRTRYEDSFWLTGALPRASDPEDYDVVLYTDSSAVAIAHTRRVTGAVTTTYTAAELTAIFGSVPAELTGDIYGINGYVGRGFPRRFTSI